jgi:hypothetical protein
MSDAFETQQRLMAGLQRELTEKREENERLRAELERQLAIESEWKLRCEDALGQVERLRKVEGLSNSLPNSRTEKTPMTDERLDYLEEGCDQEYLLCTLAKEIIAEARRAREREAELQAVIDKDDRCLWELRARAELQHAREREEDLWVRAAKGETMAATWEALAVKREAELKRAREEVESLRVALDMLKRAATRESVAMADKLREAEARANMGDANSRDLMNLLADAEAERDALKDEVRTLREALEEIVEHYDEDHQAWHRRTGRDWCADCQPLEGARAALKGAKG